MTLITPVTITLTITESDGVSSHMFKKLFKRDKWLPAKLLFAGFLALFGLIILGAIIPQAIYDANLKATGETTVGTPTGEYFVDINKTRLGTTTDYNIIYVYTVDDVDIHVNGSKDYDNDSMKIDKKKTVTVHYNKDHPGASIVSGE